MNFVSDSSYESIICGQRVALGHSSVNQILRCNEFTEALSSLWLLGGHLVGLFYWQQPLLMAICASHLLICFQIHYLPFSYSVIFPKHFSSQASSWVQPVGNASGRLKGREKERPWYILLLLYHSSPRPSQVNLLWDGPQLQSSSDSVSSLCLQSWVVGDGEG